MSFSLGHPKEQEPQILRKASFPRSTGLPVLGWAHQDHCVPIATFQNEGWCPWDTKPHTVSSRSLLNPKCWKLTWQRLFPVQCFHGDEANRERGGTASCEGSGWASGGMGQPHCHAVLSTDTSWVPWVTYRQFHWFSLPLLVRFLPIPPSRSSCLLVLLECIFIHYSSPTGLSVLTKAFN